MTTLTEKTYTHTEVLKLEQETGVKYELVDDKILAMAGETRQHKRLTGNMYVALRPKVTAKGYELLLEAKVRTQNSRYRCPDLALSCAPGEDPYVLENPCLIVEVLSESTDTTDKLEEYLKIPSLERYILVEQPVQRVVVYERQNEQWLVRILEKDGEITVPCTEATLTLTDIYG